MAKRVDAVKKAIDAIPGLTGAQKKVLQTQANTIAASKGGKTTIGKGELAEINKLIESAGGKSVSATTTAKGYTAPEPEPEPDQGKPDWMLQWEMQQEAAREAAKVSAFDLARTFANQYGIGASIADRIIDMVANQGYTSEAVALAIQDTPEYKQRFAGLELYKKKYATDIAAGTRAEPPTAAEYMEIERSYQTVLTSFGLGELANRQTFAELIGNDVSPYEVQERVVKVYDKINNADELLKQQLQTYFPNLGTSDFAKALLTGTSPQDMAAELQRKISRAEISSEMSRFGLGVRQPLSQELETLGVTREQARTGFGKIAEQLQPAEKLAQIYEGTSAGIEEELIGEQFKGLQSQRRKRLEQQERAAFAGSSGISEVSLKRQTAGTF